MSLGSLARYDDAEDEIRDEDHNLLLKPPEPVQPTVVETEPAVDSKPSPPVGESDSKPKILVPYYGGEYSDDDSSEDERPGRGGHILSTKSKSKPAVVNLGLFDGSSVLTSAETDSPKPIESVESSPRESSANDRNVSLPPEPPGRCSKSLQEKIAKMIEKKKNGRMNVNEYVQQKKAFRNPSIYDKLVTFIGIDEHGTNFPRELYDPSVWGPESYYEALAKTQKEYNTQKEKEKHKKTHVDFVSGVNKKTATSQAPTVTSSNVPEKRSKWDQKIPPPPKSVNNNPKVPPAVQAAIKSNSKN